MKLLCNEKFVDLVKSILLEVIGLKSILINKSVKLIVRDAPDQTVTDAAVSFVPPTLVLYDKIASTGVAGGAP